MLSGDFRPADRLRRNLSVGSPLEPGPRRLSPSCPFSRPLSGARLPTLGLPGLVCSGASHIRDGSAVLGDRSRTAATNRLGGFPRCPRARCACRRGLAAARRRLPRGRCAARLLQKGRQYPGGAPYLGGFTARTVGDEVAHTPEHVDELPGSLFGSSHTRPLLR